MSAGFGRRLHAKLSRQERIIDGKIHVWSIMDNAWVPLDYWRWVNGRRG